MAVAARNKPVTRRSKGQAQWLREQIEKEAPGWNPVLEMVKIARKPRLRKGDMDRLQVLEAVAKYVQPKLKQVEVEHAAAGGSGEMTIRWKG